MEVGGQGYLVYNFKKSAPDKRENRQLAGNIAHRSFDDSLSRELKGTSPKNPALQIFT